MSAVRKPTINVLLLFLAGCLLGSAHASDAAKETRWAEQIVDALIVGEAEWLEADGTKFLAIYAEETTGTPKGGVILLHGIGAHPDWPDVIHPLRVALPDVGWSTLSLQMPILPNEADAKDYAPLFDEVAPRLEAGIAFLKGQGIEDIALVAHSLGAAMGSYYLTTHPDSGIRAFVGIGMNESRQDPRMDNATSLKGITIPVLDAYGSRDLDGVLRSAKRRAVAARKAGNTAYAQREIAGADHFFNGLDADIVRGVRGWLDKNAQGPKQAQEQKSKE